MTRTALAEAATLFCVVASCLVGAWMFSAIHGAAGHTPLTALAGVPIAILWARASFGVGKELDGSR